LCAMGIEFASFYELFFFYNGCWNYCDSVVFLCFILL
jgi:hypothetical protein